MNAMRPVVKGKTNGRGALGRGWRDNYPEKNAKERLVYNWAQSFVDTPGCEATDIRDE